jgi:hypothetical protein
MTKAHDVKDRLREELRDYLAVSAYLFVCFSAVLFYGAAVRGGPAPGLGLLGLAAAKALILGKFTLIGEAVGIGSRLKSGNLARYIVRKLLLLFVLLLVLTAAEELIVGWIHGRSSAETLGEFEQRSPTEILASCLLLLLVLAPYVAVTELSRALGPGALRRLLSSPPDTDRTK